MTAMRPLGAVLVGATLFLLSVVTSASPQQRAGQETPGQLFDRALNALVSNRLDEGITLFEQHLKLVPYDEMSAYNLACAYSLKGDTRRAVEWLSKSADWGYDDLDHLRSDADLTNIRSDAGYLQVLADIQFRHSSPPAAKIPTADDRDRGSELVAMLRSELGSGAAFVVGWEGKRIYLATANHVVRRGGNVAERLEVQFRPLAPKWTKASVLAPVGDPEMDLAVIAVDDVNERDLPFCKLPITMGGDASALKKGSPVYPVGYPNGILWAMPLGADLVSQVFPTQLSFESQFIRVGFSGGALLNNRGEIVGMVTADEPPLGRAVPLQLILQTLRDARYPVRLWTAQERAGRPLAAAIKSGDVAAVRGLLERCADPGVADETGRTALHEAAAQGSVEAVQLLLKAGSRPNSWAVIKSERDAKEWGIPLHLAAERGDVGIVTALVAAGSDPGIRTLRRYGDRGLYPERSPLHIAAENNRADVVGALLAAGADPMVIGQDELTPLHVAAMKNARDAARALIRGGAPVEPRGNSKSPLHLAAERGSVDVIDLLIASGANVNVRDSNGGTPLYEASENGQVAAVKTLLANKAEVNARGYLSNTPLLPAAEKGNIAIVTALLAAGADPMVRNERNITPIAAAEERADPEILRALMRAGAPIGFSLHHILRNGKEDVARILIEGGAEVSLKDSDGREPLHIAAARGLTEAVDLLIRAGASVNAVIDRGESPDLETPLILAAEGGHDRVVERLIAAKASIDTRDRSGRTALYRAVDEGHSAVVRQLLQAGADPNIEAHYTRGDTPVTLAAGNNGPTGILALLLDFRGDANRAVNGSTPLYLAARFGYPEKVSLLLKAGASVTAAAGKSTPLHGAAHGSESATPVIDLLVAAGSLLEAVNGEKRTPLLEAAYERNDAALKALLKHGARANAADECGATALWVVLNRNARYNAREIEDQILALAQLLVNAGASVNIKQTCSKTNLIDSLEQQGLLRVRQFLISKGAVRN